MTVIRQPARVTHSCAPSESINYLDSTTPSRSTVLRATSTCRVLEEHFQMIVEETRSRQDRVEQFNLQLNQKDLSQAERDQLITAFLQEESQISRISRTRLEIARFHRIKLIGRGSFGQVFLVQDKVTGDLYALKVLSKADVILRDQISNVCTERDILSSTNNPWVVQLKASFQDNENLYLALEYLPGGDLITALQRVPKGIFSESAARFFAGEIALALHSIHSLNVIHRDLKPDNILLGEDGHIKLADFGLSANYQKAARGRQQFLKDLREFMNEHYRIRKIQPQPGHVRDLPFGSVVYTAPEVLEGEGPSFASDYWSLGVILFEMLFGFPPFRGKSPTETGMRVRRYDIILKSHLKKALVSEPAIDLIRNLLCAKERRFGFEELIRHPFFKGFDFENLKQNQPPMVPVLTHPADTSHFEDFSEGTEPHPEMGQNDLARLAFLGFTYKKRRKNMTLEKLALY